MLGGGKEKGKKGEGKQGRRNVFSGGRDEGQWVESQGGELLILPPCSVRSNTFLWGDPPLGLILSGYGRAANHKVLPLPSSGRSVTQPRQQGSGSQKQNLGERHRGTVRLTATSWKGGP